MIGLFTTKIVGGDVFINNGSHSPEFRRERAIHRVANLTAKLARLKNRERTQIIRKEIANTETAISAWKDALELANLELKQQSKRENKS